MRLPKPVYGRGRTKMTQMKFYGYDAMGTEGAICNMKNITGDYWPEIAVRERRKLVNAISTPRGIGAETEGLVWADGLDLHVRDITVEGFFDFTGIKNFVVLGDYLTVWPDGKWFDLVSGECGSIGVHVSLDGSEKASLGARFSSNENELSSRANCVGNDYDTEGRIDLSDYFRDGDAVTISGCTRHPENNKTVIIRDFTESRVAPGQIVCLDDTFTLDQVLVYTVGAEGLEAGTYNVQDDALPSAYNVELPALSEGVTLKINVQDIILGGTPEVTVSGGTGTLTMSTPALIGKTYLSFETTWKSYTEPGMVTISRDIPSMDFVFEHNNRLMGCAGDDVYVSALGDLFNWYLFDGTASDSWSVDTGTMGYFTGACSYGGYPRFFKEDRIFTLYGDYPAEYQLQGYEYMGVSPGSGKSLAVVSGRLFYLGRNGPCMFTGGAPSFMTGFGLERYRNGVAGSDGVKYWLSMEDESGKAHLFVYDTRTGLWMREDDTEAIGFAFYGENLYCLKKDGEMVILGRPYAPPADAKDEKTVDWFVEFGDFTESSPNKKTVGRLQIRMTLEAGAAATVYLKYDSEPEWNEVMTVSAIGKRSYVLPVIPRRLDHFRMKIEGCGGCRINSIAREVSAGSER